MTDQARPLPTDRNDLVLESEPLILVDDADQEIGHLDRANCHAGSGILHRAFSLLIFNGNGELLLQQRAAGTYSVSYTHLTLPTILLV